MCETGDGPWCRSSGSSVLSSRQDLLDVQCPTSPATLSVLTKQVGERPSTALGHYRAVVVGPWIHRNRVTFAVPWPKRWLTWRGTTDVAPTRPEPPELHVIKPPDRLTRTSGGFVIVEVRPAGRTRQKFLLGPPGFPLRNLTPHSSGGNRCYRTTQWRRSRRGPKSGSATSGSRSSMCRPSSISAVTRLHTSRRSSSCRRFPTHPAADPDFDSPHFPTTQPI